MTTLLQGRHADVRRIATVVAIMSLFGAGAPSALAAPDPTGPPAASPDVTGGAGSNGKGNIFIEIEQDGEAVEGRDGRVLADYEGSIASRGFLTNDQSRIRVRDVQVSREG